VGLTRQSILIKKEASTRTEYADQARARPIQTVAKAPMKLQLSLGIASNPRSWPILDGTVKPDGIELVPTVLHASELFWRQLRFADFDVSEMSFSSLMMAKARGDDRWVGLPIFTTRRFFHNDLMVRRDSKIDKPADLKGRRVGVPEYQQTAALWTRGILQHEFGVSPTEMEFWMERVPSHSHAGGVGFKAPPGVTIHQIPIEKSIGSMMVSGELEATIHYIRHDNLVDRSKVDLANHPDIKFLFPDPVAEGVRYFRKTGIYPINHGMVVRRELAEKHPWVILNLLKAFDKANAIADAERMEHVDYHVASGMISQEKAKALHEPVLRHGIKANRKILETAAQMSFEQGLTPRLMKLEEVFAASAMEQ
jgi:4,5-dihydroxyphthalate decarboxylase